MLSEEFFKWGRSETRASIADLVCRSCDLQVLGACNPLVDTSGNGDHRAEGCHQGLDASEDSCKSWQVPGRRKDCGFSGWGRKNSSMGQIHTLVGLEEDLGNLLENPVNFFWRIFLNCNFFCILASKIALTSTNLLGIVLTRDPYILSENFLGI